MTMARYDGTGLVGIAPDGHSKARWWRFMTRLSFCPRRLVGNGGR